MLSRQFIISAVPAEFPGGWNTRRLGDIFVYHAKDLPWIELEFPSGRGAILGWPIHEGRLWKDGESLSYTTDEPNRGFPAISGRFLSLVEEGGRWTAYPDPFGQLPLVYSAEHRAAASTPGLISTPEKSAIPASFTDDGLDQWFPFGLTPSQNVYRLLPNHRLDLSSFSCERFWPHPSWRIEPLDLDRALDEIVELLRGNVAAVAAGYRVIANLTAGRDTRMVLAALRGYHRDVIFSTFRFPGPGGTQDCAVARDIAARHSLNHKEIVPLPSEPADSRAWLENIGYCVVSQSMTLATTAKHISHMADFNLTGIAGEIGRAGYWVADHLAGKDVDVEELLSLTKAKDVHKFRDAATKWLGGLPPGAAHWVLDMYVMEIRIGVFAAPTFYGSCSGVISLTPFNDRRIVERALSLPAEYRFQQRFAADLLDRMWPELKEFPFNPILKVVAPAPSNVPAQGSQVLGERP